MAEESDQPQQTPAGQNSPTQQAQQGRPNQQQSGQRRRHDRRDRNPGQGRRPAGQHHNFRRDRPPQPAQDKPAESDGKAEDIDADDESGHDRSSQPRRHHRGGRPPKKIVEEWASDIYCE